MSRPMICNSDGDTTLTEFVPDQAAATDYWCVYTIWV